MATLTAVLLASLFGSLHCVGMCGPLMAFAVGTADGLSHALSMGSASRVSRWTIDNLRAARRHLRALGTGA